MQVSFWPAGSPTTRAVFSLVLLHSHPFPPPTRLNSFKGLMIIFADCNVSPISHVMHQTSQEAGILKCQGAVSASRLPELSAMHGTDLKAVSRLKVKKGQ